MEVIGTGCWSPGIPNARAWFDATQRRPCTTPPCDIVGPRLARGVSLLTRMQVECATQAGTDAGLDLRTTPTVFGSAHGEIQIALAQMRAMREGDGLISPAGFKNSVHNTASGIFSIATKNRGFTTAVAGGPLTLVGVLVEAWALLATGGTAVIAVVADEPLPEPLGAPQPHEALAVSFALGRASPNATRRIGPPRPCTAPALEPLPERFRRAPCAAALLLLDAVQRVGSRRQGLTTEGCEHWCVDLTVVP